MARHQIISWFDTVVSAHRTAGDPDLYLESVEGLVAPGYLSFLRVSDGEYVTLEFTAVDEPNKKLTISGAIDSTDIDLSIGDACQMAPIKQHFEERELKIGNEIANNPYANSVLFADADGNLESSSNFTFSDADGANIVNYTKIGTGGGLGDGLAGLEVCFGGNSAINAVGSGFPAVKAASTTNNVTAKIQALGSASAVYFGAESNHELRLGTNNIGRITVTTAGLVGVNEGSPNAQLQVTCGSSSTKGLLVKAANSASVNIVDVRSFANDELFSVAANGALKALKTSSGEIANFGANSTAGILTFAYDVIATGSTDIKSSPYGPLVLATQSNNNILLAVNGTGKVGVNQTSPIAKLHITNGSESFGDFATTNTITRSLSRTLPTNTSTNNGVDIASVTLTNGAAHFAVTVTIASSGYSTSKYYNFAASYNQTNNVWTTAIPLASTGAYQALQDSDLEINVSNFVLSLRLRRTLGTTAGTASITIEHQGTVTDTFTASSTVATVTAPTTFFPATNLTQVAGKVGLNTLAPTGQFQAVSSAAGTKVAVFQAAASPSVAVTEWQDSNAAVLASVVQLAAARGAVRAGGTATAEIGSNGSNFPYLKGSANGLTLDTNNVSSGYANVYVLTHTGYGLRVSSGNSNAGAATDGRLFVDAGANANKVVVLRANSGSQTGAFVECQASNGSTILASIDASGVITGSNVKGSTKSTKWSLALGGPASTGTDVANWSIIDEAVTATSVLIAAKTPPVGASFIVDILQSTDGSTWTSLWATTPANRPTLTSGTTVATFSAFDSTAIPANSLLRCDIVQVGSSTPGESISLSLRYKN